MNIQSYSEKFKKSAVQKLLSSKGSSLNATAKKIGIASSTLFGWKKKYANYSTMKQSKKNDTDNWTPEQKLEAIIKTTSLSENELGEYLRANGLHSTDLENWKTTSLSGFKFKQVIH